MDFIDLIDESIKNEKTLTDNGAVAYKSAGNPMTDFAFGLTGLMKSEDFVIENSFSRVFFDDKVKAMRFLFWVRDPRKGNGMRRIFRVCLTWLSRNKPEFAKAVLDLVPDYGRWDDLWGVLDTDLREDVISLVSKRLEKDCDAPEVGGQMSLLGKWMPSLNTSSMETRHYASILCNGLDMTPKKYRKMLSNLRANLGVVECKMSDNKWDEINYPHVPSKANLIYANAFMRHDEERRKEYLESLKRGETKINASVLFPNEIVHKYRSKSYLYGPIKAGNYDESLEQLWNNLPDVTIGDTLVVRDGSGSMTYNFGSPSCPMDVATGLAIYMADHNSGPWKNKFITFSSNPRLVNLSKCESLRDKLLVTYRETEVSNTNIEKTMMLILNTAIQYNCSQDEMPKNIICISDMQFDLATSGRRDKALFDEIAQKFKDNGYEMPRIIFWNVSGALNNTIPMKENDRGVVLCSGFSVNLLKMVMSGKTDPYEAILDAINDSWFSPVEKAVEHLI